RLWDVETGKLAATLVEDGPDVTGLAFTPDGTQLALACADGTLRRLDVAGGKEVERLAVGDHLYNVWFSPDRKLVLLPVTRETRPGQPPPPSDYQLREVGARSAPAGPGPNAR